MFRHLASSIAVPGRCRKCGRPILVGLDEGSPVRVDLECVDPAGEVAALIQGHRSFASVAGGELAERTVGRIRAGLVGSGVRIEHRCLPGSRRE